ncbi:hypothetical protein [Hymenobacter arcticus]
MITDDDELIRRVPLNPNCFKVNEKGDTILSSAAFSFKKDEDGWSVDIAALTTLEQAIYSQRTQAGGAVTGAFLLAAVPLELGCTCEHNPTPASGDKPANEAHALIKGNMTKSVARKLAESCRLIEPPTVN